METESSVKARAIELVQVVANQSNHIAEDDRIKAVEQFSVEPQLRHAITGHFEKDLDKDEDVVCDTLRSHLGATSATHFTSFAASFLPLATRQVMSSVNQGTSDSKIPLHKFVIAANNFMASIHQLGFFEARLPDLRQPSNYHKLKSYYVHGEPKRFEVQGETGAQPKRFTGSVVNACLSSEIFVGAVSCYVYLIQKIDFVAHLDMTTLCLYVLCHGIRELEFKAQVIVGKLREEVEKERLDDKERGLRRHVLQQLRQIYSGKDSDRIAITSAMYIVMSQALTYLLKTPVCESHPLLQEMCAMAYGMMRERAEMDMNSIAIMLAESLAA